MRLEYRYEVVAAFSPEERLVWGKTFALLRKTMGLSQGQMAVVFGLSYSAIGAWEIGVCIPYRCSLRIIETLARYNLWEAEVDRLRASGALTGDLSHKKAAPTPPINRGHAEQLRAFRKRLRATSPEMAQILGVSRGYQDQMARAFRSIGHSPRRVIEILSLYGLWEKELARIRGRPRGGKELTFDFYKEGG